MTTSVIFGGRRDRGLKTLRGLYRGVVAILAHVVVVKRFERASVANFAATCFDW
jgi:hypothetical protein